MKIEKLACCLAHPVTALRAIKEKVNEIIDGLEGVQAGGGSGGGGAYIVTATKGELLDDMNTIFSVTADKTGSEMMEAFESGHSVMCRCDMEDTGDFFIAPLVIAGPESGLQFSVYTGGMTIMFAFGSSDDTTGTMMIIEN